MLHSQQRQLLRSHHLHGRFCLPRHSSRMRDVTGISHVQLSDSSSDNSILAPRRFSVKQQTCVSTCCSVVGPHRVRHAVAKLLLLHLFSGCPGIHGTTVLPAP
jgi:hypothetical protein